MQFKNNIFIYNCSPLSLSLFKKFYILMTLMIITEISNINIKKYYIKLYYVKNN